MISVSTIRRCGCSFPIVAFAQALHCAGQKMCKKPLQPGKTKKRFQIAIFPVMLT